MTERLGLEEMRKLLGEVFAPWIGGLRLRPEAVEEDRARFVLPANPLLARGGGDGPPTICGQAIGAAADTASVVALMAFNGRLRNCTTVDMTTHFLRPLPVADVEAVVHLMSNGRRMATTRVEFRAVEGPGKLAASATCAFAYLED